MYPQIVATVGNELVIGLSMMLATAGTLEVGLAVYSFRTKSATESVK